MINYIRMLITCYMFALFNCFAPQITIYIWIWQFFNKISKCVQNLKYNGLYWHAEWLCNITMEWEVTLQQYFGMPLLKGC